MKRFWSWNARIVGKPPIVSDMWARTGDLLMFSSLCNSLDNFKSESSKIHVKN